MTKTAYVHDWIFHIGGAEAVFFDIIGKELHTDGEAHIFTLFSDKKSIDLHGKTYHITTALPKWLNNIFVRGSQNGISILDYRNLFAISPLLCTLLSKKMRTYDPDKISISSFAAVKNIVSEKQVELYLHSPNQYIWENHKEYLQKVSGRKGILFNKLIPKLRKRDTKHRSYTSIFANSEYTKQTAIALYGSEFEKTKVKYPQLEKEFYQTDPVRSPKEYFIYVGRLTRLVKEVDTIIELFNQTGLPLIIMGSGPDEDYLKSLAGPTITFIGRVTEVSEKIKIIKYARGLVNLSKESCGIATMEALSLGVPVFGYDAGGTKELVGEESGILVSDKKLSTLKRSLLDFSQGAYSRNLIKETIQQKLLKSLEDRGTNPGSNI